MPAQQRRAEIGPAAAVTLIEEQSSAATSTAQRLEFEGGGMLSFARRRPG
jgi:hypothetical protein